MKLSSDGPWALLTQRASFTAALPVILMAVLAIWWGYTLDRADLRDRLRLANAGNLEALEKAFAEFNALAMEMRGRREAGCSTENLEYFRRFLFTLQRLRDVGLVEDRHLLCSTALGVIERPTRSSDPDLILPSGLEVYAYRPVRVSESRPTTVLQLRRFNALIDPALVASFTERFPVAGAWIRASADAPAFPLFDADTVRPADTLRDLHCSTRFSLCLEAAPGRGATSANPRRAIGLGVLGAGTGLAMFLLVQGLVWRARDPYLRLRRAIRDGELQAAYQPLIGLPDGELKGFELLARWPDAPEELAGPDRFISEAENRGLIHELTELMIRRAAAELGPTLREYPELRLAVNISAHELRGNALREILEQHMLGTGVAANQLVLELTERSMATPHRRELNLLAGQGFRVFIDDLGEGYSSLSYLHHLLLAGVKISRSFVSGLGTGSPKADLVVAMVDIARKLQLDVVLEGIETEAAHQAAADLGPITCQGYHYARPMDIEQLGDWMVTHYKELSAKVSDPGV